ncbi:acriflavine resistance protein [Actinobacillus equuli]|nr:acriflavine resistance protein [Actinobacillus equuli]
MMTVSGFNGANSALSIISLKDWNDRERERAPIAADVSAIAKMLLVWILMRLHSLKFRRGKTVYRSH